MICPKCGIDGIVEPTPLPALKGRRHSAFRECPCGAYVRFNSLEGWPCWYAVSWWPRANAEYGERQDLPGLEEFNRRYYDGG